MEFQVGEFNNITHMSRHPGSWKTTSEVAIATLDTKGTQPVQGEQRSKFHMYWSHLRLTRIHTGRKLFPEVRKVSVRFAVSHA